MRARRCASSLTWRSSRTSAATSRDNELLFTAYAYQGGEVFGIDLDPGVVRNHSNSSAYEEVEGVGADGRVAYVERDLAYDGMAPGPLDI